MDILNMPIQDVVSLIKEHFTQSVLFKEIQLLDSEVDETLLKEPYLVFDFNFKCELPELPEMELIEPSCKIVNEEEQTEPILMDSTIGILDSINFISKTYI